MRTELRFVLAIVLMVGILVVTNLLFPPTKRPTPPGATVPESARVADTLSGPPATGAGAGATAVPESASVASDTGAAPAVPAAGASRVPAPETAAGAPAGGRTIVVEGPLYRYTFSTKGAELVSARLLKFRSFQRKGSVELIPDGTAALGNRLVVGKDTLDLTRVLFKADAPDTVHVGAGGGGSPTELAFTYRHPSAPFQYRIVYTFRPNSYVVDVRGTVKGLHDTILYTSLGDGLAFNERQHNDELQSMAYVGNHLQEGIHAWNLAKLKDSVAVREGPFVWAALKSKYFLMAILPGTGGSQPQTHLGGIIQRKLEQPARAAITVTQPVGSDDSFAYRVFMGPQDFARLTSIGQDLEGVNPYGWRFLRPIIRPLVGIVMAILTFLHGTLGWGYGWVLILFGVMMRVLLFPLNQKAMRAQLRNMAVQPLVKEIQKKYKDQPDKQQQEMMKLYKEHGFNPLAGCLPMLLPWPVLVTLFFVFRNTIELRGVPFLWLPDLSSADPLYILPALLGVSMFLLQYISYRSMDEPNPQMKMMMWVMPAFMVFLFMRFASGLDLYYVTANIATLPQQFWIARERQKAQKHGPAGTGDGGG